jgi:hypothetical protein
MPLFSAGMLVACVASGHTAVSQGPNDVCKTPTPAGPVPLPYPNIALSATMGPGSGAESGRAGGGDGVGAPAGGDSAWRASGAGGRRAREWRREPTEGAGGLRGGGPGDACRARERWVEARVDGVLARDGDGVVGAVRAGGGVRESDAGAGDPRGGAARSRRSGGQRDGKQTFTSTSSSSSYRLTVARSMRPSPFRSVATTSVAPFPAG